MPAQESPSDSGMKLVSTNAATVKNPKKILFPPAIVASPPCRPAPRTPAFAPLRPCALYPHSTATNARHAVVARHYAKSH